MDFTTLRIPGTEAIRKLIELRARYPASEQYPFLIGDSDALQRLEEMNGFSERDASAIVQASLDIKVADWIARRQHEAEKYELSIDGILGEWPGEICDKGSISLHRDVLSGQIKPEVYLGFAKLDTPWNLPAMVRFGAWNECPDPEVHCAFHRKWQTQFGSEITGVSNEIVECAVRNPPTNQKAATNLAWEQYWYCSDIVEPGCGSIAKLAAILLNSHYWYFWWD